MTAPWKISGHRPASSRSAYRTTRTSHYTARASERKYALQLEVRLKNGKYLPPFNFDVTDQVAAQPQGGVIVVSGIEISDEDGTEGGFRIRCERGDWGEYEDVELPL